MDIVSVFFILSVSVAGTAFMTWVPAYRKGVRVGKRSRHLNGVHEGYLLGWRDCCQMFKGGE